MSKDYIPRHDAEFQNWFDNIVKYVTARTAGGNPIWSYIPASAVQQLKAAFDDWDANYTPTLQPHTPALTVEKNNARTRAESAIRPFVQRFLHWDPVTDGDRTNMGIPLRSGTRTQHHEVTEIVEFDLTLHNIREILVEFWIKGNAVSKAKPQGYDGTVIIWDVLAAPPERPDSLNRHTIFKLTA